MTFTTNDEHDILDGDLVVRVSEKFYSTACSNIHSKCFRTTIRFYN